MKQLQSALAQAIADPRSTDFDALWVLLLEVLAPLPPRQQFEIAGDVLLQMADILWRRAEVLLLGHQPESAEAIAHRLTRELIEPFTRTMQLNTANFVKPKPQRKQKVRAISPNDSIVGEVDKTVLLNVLDQVADDDTDSYDIDDACQDPINLSHDEAIGQWAGDLIDYLTDRPLSLLDLGDRAQMPLVQVWITVLLDEQFDIQQRGDFYQTETVMVAGRSQISANQME
jgi:hypothetical protein